MPHDTLLQTKLIPPRPQRQTLPRPRLLTQLRQALDYRLTIVQAGTGYGKSTALAQLAETDVPLFWYSVRESDIDPHQFLRHLIAAFCLGLPGMDETPLGYLRGADANPLQLAADALLNALNRLIKQPTLLVFDDFHLAASEEVIALTDYYFDFCPRDLHAIISTRYPTEWEHLSAWQAHGQVLEIKWDALAFTPDEVQALFADKYALPLSSADLDLLISKTEGWPAALQLIGQAKRSHPDLEIADLLSPSNSHDRSLDALFNYLARDILAQQSAAVQDWLLQTSVLRELDPDVCQAVTGAESGEILAQLVESNLFVIRLGDNHYRYHNLFHDFLRAQAMQRDRDAIPARHQRAAEFYRGAGNLDEAIYHLLTAQAFEDAIGLIEQAGEYALRAGRLEALAGWMGAVPPHLLEKRPLLQFYSGELDRLRSRFDRALDAYSKAEALSRAAVPTDPVGIARALRGQALVFLQTLHTPQADLLLQEALKLDDAVDDRETQAGLLETLAESKLNLGRADKAEELRRQARDLREDVPGDELLGARVKMRTGRLNEARSILETLAQDHSEGVYSPHRTREASLLLSLIYSAQGLADDAFTTARRGMALGVEHDSPYGVAMGQIRLGHAYQLFGDWRGALDCYEKGIALGDQVGLHRVRAEARWGMTRAHEMAGDLEAAQHDAREALEIGKSSGDVWTVGQVHLALGAGAVLGRRFQEGTTHLVDALVSFHGCGDTFSSASAWMWLALADWHAGNLDHSLAHLLEALVVAQSKGYDYLFTTRTLLGLHDPAMIVPLLIAARSRSRRSVYVGQLLARMGLDYATRHPGYQLRVQTLGPWRVWRGEVEVPKKEWQRKKARQLLQLFIAQRRRMLDREEIFEMLFPTESLDAAARDFKVALNALNRVLEPGRSPDAAPAFIAREETAYGLATGIDVWLDTDEFTRLIARADTLDQPDAAFDLYGRALALYHDDFLRLEAPYEDWALAERERLQTLYLRAADHVAKALLERGELPECETWCAAILARDRCWEHAYRLLMQISLARGDTVHARRIFDDCQRVLAQDLGVPPSSATVQILQQALTPPDA